MENVDQREDIQHAGVRGCLEFLDINDGIEVIHVGDLPARSGLGSSSAFTVGMLSALHALRGEAIGPGRLSDEAIAVEQEVLCETVGVQDQIACAWGGLNVIKIDREGNYSISPIILPAERIKMLESRLMLVFTGIQRHASEIAKAQIENTEQNREELEAIAALVPRASAVLRGGDLDDLGRLLHEGWKLKRRLSDKISSPKIDALYEQVIAAGALGGKILGAGGGGFFLFYVPPDKQSAVREVLDNQLLGAHLDVTVCFENIGSHVVLG